jgi:hypothetical protein
MKSSNPTQQNRSDYQDRQVLYRPSQGIPRGFGRQHTHPKRIDIFLHVIKTGKLIGALLTDRRIPIWRKALFFGSIAGLLFVLLFPDALNEAVLSTVLPLAGTVLGIPLDAGFDWVAFALVVVTLLRFFPPEILAEHYRRIFS